MDSTVVIGYDGSPAGRRALAEAAREASLRDVPLTVVHAVAPQETGPLAAGSPPAARTRRQAAARLLADAADLVRSRHPGVAVRTRAVAGAEPGALTAAAHDADLLVLGSRGLSHLEGVLLGSVSARTLAEADRPVLVVHDGDGDGERAPHGPVLACVDLAGSDEEVLGFAFAEAARRREPLRAVHVWDQTWVYDSAADTMDADAAVAMDLTARGDRLAALVRRWRTRYPGVRAGHDLLKGGDPGAALAGASRTADLLVVGARRRTDGRPGLRVGPVTRRLLRHAACPVAVVPAG